MSDTGNTPQIQAVESGHVPDGPDSDFDPIALAREQEAAAGGGPKQAAKPGSRAQSKQTSTPNVDLSAQGDEEAELEDDSGDEPEDEAEAPEEFDLKVKDKTYKVKGIDGLKAAAQRGIAEQQARQKERAEFQTAMTELKRLQAEFRAKSEMSPEELFRQKYGEKAEDAMEQILLDRAKEAAQLAQMTPRERELYAARKADQAKLSAYEKEKKAQEAKADEELVKTQRATIEGVFSEALTKHGVPVTGASVRIMAAVYRANLEAGNQMDAAQAAAATKKQMFTIFSEVAKGMKPAEFVAAFPDLAKAVRTHFVQAKQGGQPLDAVEVAPRRQVSPTKRKPLNSQEAWEKEYNRLKEQGDRDLQRLNNGGR